MRTYRVWIGYGLLFVFLIWIVSCRYNLKAVPAPDPTPTPSPRQVLDRSGERMLALKTVSFALEIEGSDQFFPGVQWHLIEGKVDIPDRLEIRVEATSIFPRTFFEISIVAVEDHAFMADPITGKWNPISKEVLPFDFDDLGRTFQDMMKAVQNPTFTGIDEVDSVSSWRMKGSILSEKLAAIIPGVDPGYVVGLKAWVGQSDRLLRKLRMEGQMDSNDDPNVVRVLTLHGFGEAVEISLPQNQ